MAKNYIQPGHVMDFIAAADVVSGQVVRVGNTLGVSLGDYKNGDAGELQISGVFEVPKVTTAVIAQGASVLWDASAGKFDVNSSTPASGDVGGASASAFKAGANGDTTIWIRFSGAPGTLTP
ncbi:MAG: DUF2190 family protein [Methylophilaceae bacterium]